MKTNSSKIDFFFNFISKLPKIIFRFLRLLIFKQKVVYKDVKLDNLICIEGTLNQLIWKVENSVFITISNSTRIFFDSGQLIFHVDSNITDYEIKFYGFDKVKKIKVSIKVITLEKKEINALINKSLGIKINNNNFQGQLPIGLMPTRLCLINTSKPIKVKLFDQVKIRLPSYHNINEYSSTILNTTTEEEAIELIQRLVNN